MKTSIDVFFGVISSILVVIVVVTVPSSLKQAPKTSCWKLTYLLRFSIGTATPNSGSLGVMYPQLLLFYRERDLIDDVRDETIIIELLVAVVVAVTFCDLL